MSWTVNRVGETEAVRARVTADFAAIEKDTSQSPLELEAARSARAQIEEAMKCQVPADYFGGSVAGWKVQASASFSSEGMLNISVNVDRTPLEITK